MSFNDVAKQPKQQQPVRSSLGNSSVPSSGSFKSSNSDPMIQIGEALQHIQKCCISIKDKITEMRRRKVNAGEKSELDGRLRELRELESKTKQQIDSQYKLLDSIPRSESSQKRLTIGKLQKDHDRLKQLILALTSESNLIKVSADSSSGYMNASSRNEDSESHSSSGNLQKKSMVMLKEVDIDTLIIEERERDIRKINQDILIVNEMFQDMANIVEKQGVHIEEIVTSTEKSHEKAQQGLDQIKQASEHQAACIIS